MSFFNMNVVGFRRVYYENWSSQAQAKMPWVPTLSRQPRSSHAVARCSVRRFLGGSEMLNQGEWLGGGCEDARDKVRKDDVGSGGGL